MIFYETLVFIKPIILNASQKYGLGFRARRKPIQKRSPANGGMSSTF